MIRGWIDGRVSVAAADLSQLQMAKIEKNLTLKNRQTKEELKLYSVGDFGRVVNLPRSYAKHFPELEDRRTRGRELQDIESKFTPSPKHPGQEAAVGAVYRFLSTDPSHSGCLDAPCGAGKTYQGIQIAWMLGRSTCILVHKGFLMRQWQDSIAELLPDAKVGICQLDRCDTGKDFDFVIAMVSSLTSKTRVYPKEFYESFGLVIGDEVHRHAGGTWQLAITQFPALYRLGLTATYRRKDGMLPVIEHNFGPVIHRMARTGLKAKIHFVSLKTAIPESAYIQPWDKKLGRARLVNSLAYHKGRNRYISNQLQEALGAGRKVMVLSERLQQLDELSEMLMDSGYSESKIGFFIGGKKQDALDEAAARPLVLSTYQMAQEALNIKELDTLFLASPLVDVEQSIGRILRELEGKKEPIVIDYVDRKVPPCVGYQKARERLYTELGYSIQK